MSARPSGRALRLAEPFPRKQEKEPESPERRGIRKETEREVYRMRSGGILMHLTSLPSPGGIGDLGKEAYAFADFLQASGMKIWQVLPVGPTGYGESPYQSTSAFAGNPLLISLPLLREQGLLDIRLTDIRSFSAAKHKNTDDYPFGGGAGMVMTAQPIMDAMASASAALPGARRIYLGPRGKKLTTALARELAAEDSLILLCGHYEGVDQRALDECVDEEISIGDYILTGGELAAMVLTDCVARFIPGVLGSAESPERA